MGMKQVNEVESVMCWECPDACVCRVIFEHIGIICCWFVVCAVREKD